MNGSNITPKDLTNTTDIKITNFLENEKNANKKECWTKLDKTQKIKHINVYCEILKEKDNLTDKELEELKNYVFRCVERKYLLKAKEVNYDKNENIFFCNAKYEKTTTIGDYNGELQYHTKIQGICKIKVYILK